MFRKAKINKHHEMEIDRELDQLESEVKEVEKTSPELDDLYSHENHHDKKNIHDDINNFKPKVKTWWQRVQTASSILIIVLIVSAAAGWFFFQQNRTPFSGQGLALSWLTAENIASGELTALKLTVENKEQIALEKVVIDITLPSNFVVSKTMPELREGSVLRWRLDTLDAGDKVEAIIEGSFTGPEDKVTVRAYATYNPKGLTSNFSASNEQEISILKSDYEVTLNPAVTFKIGEKQNLELKVVSKNAMTNAVIQVLVPEAVGVSEIKPAKDKDVSEDRLIQWSLSEIKAGDSNTFNFAVTPSAQTPANSNVAIIIGVKQDQTMKVLSTIIKPFGLNSSAVDVKLTAPNVSKYLDWGTDVAMQVVLKSLAQGTYKDVKITVNLNGPVRWGSLKGEIKPQDGFGQNMVWTEKEFSDLKNIGASPIVLPFTLTTENSANVGDSTLTGKVIFSGILTTETDKGGFLVVVESVFGPMQLKGALNLRAVAQYFDENMQPVGAGPLPPIAGKDTSYSVVWFINSASQNLKNLEIKTILPVNVNFNTSLTPNVLFEPSTRSVIWRASQLEKSSTASRIEFTVTVRPQAADAGKVIGIINRTTATGLDEQNQSITQSAEALSTADAVSGKGVVQAQ